MSIKVLSTLGQGTFGEVYLVKRGDKKYAMRKSKYVKSLEPVSLPRFTTNEKKLFRYPESVTIETCDFHLPTDEKLKEIGATPNSMAMKLKKSTKCKTMYFSLLDVIISDLFKSGDYTKLSTQHRQSIFFQFLLASQLLYEKGYSHNDAYASNMGLCRTSQKNLPILGYKMPTYGTISVLFDYDILKKKIDKKRNRDMLYMAFNLGSAYNYVNKTRDYVKSFRKMASNPSMWKAAKLFALSVVSDEKKILNWYKYFDKHKKPLDDDDEVRLYIDSYYMFTNRQLYFHMVDIPYIEPFIPEYIMEFVMYNSYQPCKVLDELADMWKY